MKKPCLKNTSIFASNAQVALIIEACPELAAALSEAEGVVEGTAEGAIQRPAQRT